MRSRDKESRLSPTIAFLRKRLGGDADAFYTVAVLLALTSAIAALFLPSDKFILAPGSLGDKWSLLGIVGVLIAVISVNFTVSRLMMGRDKVLFWLLSVGSAIAGMLVFLKVASVIYFW